MRFTCIVLLMVGFNVHGQHCSFDFVNIIVVRPHAQGDTTVIDGLRIVLVDKDSCSTVELPATSSRTPHYLFQRNTDPPTQWLHPATWKRNGKRQFPFAQDNYFLLVPNDFHVENYRVLVVDERPANDGPRFRQQLMHLHPEQSHRLCGRHNDEVYQVASGEPAFAPVTISLLQQ